MTVTWPMMAWAAGIFITWTGFLIGVIRWFLKREIQAFETRQSAVEKKAGDAVASLATHKETMTTSLITHKESVTAAINSLKVEFSQRVVCGNHQRMEDNDARLFKRLDQLHGDVRELVGGVKGLANQLELVNQHLLNGGK